MCIIYNICIIIYYNYICNYAYIACIICINMYILIYNLLYTIIYYIQSIIYLYIQSIYNLYIERDYIERAMNNLIISIKVFLK